MVTLSDKFENMLSECMLMPEDIKTVMDIAKKELPESIEWNSSADGYPVVFYSATWFSIKRIVLTWIDENCPNAFYRMMFE